MGSDANAASVSHDAITAIGRGQRQLQSASWTAAERSALRDGIVGALVVPADTVSVVAASDLATAALSLATPAIEQRTGALIASVNDAPAFLAAVQLAAPALSGLTLELTVTAAITNVLLAPSTPPPLPPPPPPLPSPTGTSLGDLNNATSSSALSNGEGGDPAQGASNGASNTGLLIATVIVVLMLAGAITIIFYCTHKRRQTLRRSRTGGPMPFAIPSVRASDLTMVAVESATSTTASNGGHVPPGRGAPMSGAQVLDEWNVRHNAVPATVVGAPLQGTEDPVKVENDSSSAAPPAATFEMDMGDAIKI